MIVLLMGVTGAGKTTVGRLLAQRLRWRFVDADDFHSAANIAKMRAGIPLTDADRAPWLRAIHDAIRDWVASGENIVLACSALRASYREILLVSPEVKLVYLHASVVLITERIAKRSGSYMNPHLIPSQFETLEEPPEALTVDASMAPDEVVAKVRAALGI